MSPKKPVVPQSKKAVKPVEVKPDPISSQPAMITSTSRLPGSCIALFPLVSRCFAVSSAPAIGSYQPGNKIEVVELVEMNDGTVFGKTADGYYIEVHSKGIDNVKFM